MKDPKFDIGDVLGLVMDSTGKIKLHVIEVLTQKCPADIEQIRYVCRVYTERFKGDAPSFLSAYLQFNEMEVREFVDSKT